MIMMYGVFKISIQIDSVSLWLKHRIMEYFNLCTWIISLTPLLTPFPWSDPSLGALLNQQLTNRQISAGSSKVNRSHAILSWRRAKCQRLPMHSTRKLIWIWCGTTRIIIPPASFCHVFAHLASEHHCHCLPFAPMAIPCPHLHSWGLPGLWGGAHNISDSLRELHTWFCKTRVMLVAHCCRFNGRASVHGTAPNVFVFWRLYKLRTNLHYLFGSLPSIYVKCKKISACSNFQL